MSCPPHAAPRRASAASLRRRAPRARPPAGPGPPSQAAGASFALACPFLPSLTSPSLCGGSARSKKSGAASGGKKGGPSRDREDDEQVEYRGPPPRLAPAFPPPRLVELIEPETGRRLECLLRRRAMLPGDRIRALLTPLDAAVTLLRADPEGEFSSPDDDEVTAAFPDAAEALLTQRGLLLRQTPFCLTMRGPLSYNEADVITLQEDEADGGDDSLGIEVCQFETRDGGMFLVYASVDPLVILAQPSSNPDGTPIRCMRQRA